MKKLIIILFLICGIYSFTQKLYSQNITLDQCITKAVNNYPTIKEFDLIEQSENYNLSMINMIYYPQLSFSAQTTYQTHVPQLDIDFPGITIPKISKNQYDVHINLQQQIWDGGLSTASENIVKANTEIKKGELEVELYELKNRVQNIYFSILLLNEQIEQQNRIIKEWERQLEKIEKYINNGVLSQKDADLVKVEIINTEKNLMMVRQTKNTYLQMLSYLTKIEFSADTELIKPEEEVKIDFNNVDRPEIRLLNAQYELFSIKEYNIKIKSTPVFGFFVKGGYGRPGLNFFDDSFKPYAIGGINISWNFGNLYSINDEREEYILQKKNIDLQKEKFVYNVNLNAIEYQNNIKKYENLIEYDKSIIQLREQLKDAAIIESESGNLPISELIERANMLEIAKQELYHNEIKLLMEMYNLKNIINSKPL